MNRGLSGASPFMIRLIVHFCKKKLLVVLPSTASIKEVKDEIVRVYDGITSSAPAASLAGCTPRSAAIVELQNIYGCALYDEYLVGTALHDMAVVYALTEDDPTTPQSTSVDPGTMMPSHSWPYPSVDGLGLITPFQTPVPTLSSQYHQGSTSNTFSPSTHGALRPPMSGMSSQGTSPAESPAPVACSTPAIRPPATVLPESPLPSRASASSRSTRGKGRGKPSVEMEVEVSSDVDVTVGEAETRVGGNVVSKDIASLSGQSSPQEFTAESNTTAASEERSNTQPASHKANVRKPSSQKARVDTRTQSKGSSSSKRRNVNTNSSATARKKRNKKEQSSQAEAPAVSPGTGAHSGRSLRKSTLIARKASVIDSLQRSSEQTSISFKNPKNVSDSSPGPAEPKSMDSDAVRDHSVQLALSEAPLSQTQESKVQRDSIISEEHADASPNRNRRSASYELVGCEVTKIRKPRSRPPAKATARGKKTATPRKKRAAAGASELLPTDDRDSEELQSVLHSDATQLDTEKTDDNGKVNKRGTSTALSSEAHHSSVSTPTKQDECESESEVDDSQPNVLSSSNAAASKTKIAGDAETLTHEKEPQTTKESCPLDETTSTSQGIHAVSRKKVVDSAPSDSGNETECQNASQTVTQTGSGSSKQVTTNTFQSNEDSSLSDDGMDTQDHQRSPAESLSNVAADSRQTLVEQVPVVNEAHGEHPKATPIQTRPGVVVQESHPDDAHLEPHPPVKVSKGGQRQKKCRPRAAKSDVTSLPIPTPPADRSLDLGPGISEEEEEEDPLDAILAQDTQDIGEAAMLPQSQSNEKEAIPETEGSISEADDDDIHSPEIPVARPIHRREKLEGLVDREKIADRDGKGDMLSPTNAVEETEKEPEERSVSTLQSSVSITSTETEDHSMMPPRDAATVTVDTAPGGSVTVDEPVKPKREKRKRKKHATTIAVTNETSVSANEAEELSHGIPESTSSGEPAIGAKKVKKRKKQKKAKIARGTSGSGTEHTSSTEGGRKKSKKKRKVSRIKRKARQLLLSEDDSDNQSDAKTGTVTGPSAGPIAGPGAEPIAGTSAGPIAGPGAEPIAGTSAGPIAGPGAEPIAGPSAKPIAGTSAGPIAGTSVIQTSAGPSGSRADHLQVSASTTEGCLVDDAVEHKSSTLPDTCSKSSDLRQTAVLPAVKEAPSFSEDSSTDSESTGGEEAKVAGSKGLGVMLVAARKKKPRKRTCLAALVDVGRKKLPLHLSASAKASSRVAFSERQAQRRFSSEATMKLFSLTRAPKGGALPTPLRRKRHLSSAFVAKSPQLKKRPRTSKDSKIQESQPIDLSHEELEFSKNATSRDLSVLLNDEQLWEKE